MNNLTNNAIKFTEKGKVNIHLSLEDQNHLKFAVSDTGIGIPEKAKEKLFEKFYQVKDGTLNRIKGTGLGLAICKELSNLMGGNIGVESTMREGSTFWFTIAFSEGRKIVPEQIKIAKEIKKNLQLNVLLVEDNKVNQKVAMIMLKMLGCEVSIADNGQIAVDQAQESAYDLILMDIQMPVMGGVEAMKLIKENQGKNCPPIIALSANAMEGDGEKYIKEGFDAYLTKPITKDAIEKEIIRYFH